jgi:hypothetical protein
MKALMFVGVARFELATSCSQSRRDNRATLHPELLKNESANIVLFYHYEKEILPEQMIQIVIFLSQ